MIASNIVAIIFSIVGIVGAKKDNYGMLISFGVGLVIANVLQIADYVRTIKDIAGNAARSVISGLAFDSVSILVTIYFSYIACINAIEVRKERKLEEERRKSRSLTFVRSHVRENRNKSSFADSIKSTI